MKDAVPFYLKLGFVALADQPDTEGSCSVGEESVKSLLEPSAKRQQIQHLESKFRAMTREEFSSSQKSLFRDYLLMLNRAGGLITMVYVRKS